MHKLTRTARSALLVATLAQAVMRVLIYIAPVLVVSASLSSAASGEPSRRCSPSGTCLGDTRTYCGKRTGCNAEQVFG
jgi:hypothetical protein